jgi:hypothetical protein
MILPYIGVISNNSTSLLFLKILLISVIDFKNFHELYLPASIILINLFPKVSL